MKCCGREMYDNGSNYRCGICGKRIYKTSKPLTPRRCPVCGADLFDNGNNIHCQKCGFREYV